ncbi:MAG: diacylglycerol/lipid kinase family protein [Gemmatimonadales bacterium]
MATRALVITNPAAARTDQVAARAVVSALQRGGWEVELIATGGPGDARRFAASAVADRFDVFTVFGGDGTTMQAASALVGSDVALGVVPGGTGNLLAGNLRIPQHPLRAAAALIAGSSRALDLGRLERPDGTHYFAVACGAGYDARVMAGTTTSSKHRWRFAAYVATTLRLIPELRSKDHVITVDGVEYEAKATMILVANCGEIIPPYVRLRRGISPYDGLLDVVVLRADGFVESIQALWELFHESERSPGDDGFVGYAQGREISISSTPPEPVQLDGDAGGETPFSVSIVPGAIRVLIPPAP